jgi:hypothetical protein
MLAYVSIGSWSATERDDDLMEEVKQAHNASGDVGTVIKFLMTGADSKLKQVKATYQAVRNHHYKLTLPWVVDPSSPSQKGPRLLPHLLYSKYVTEVSAKRREALSVLDDFLIDYPRLAGVAQQQLGSMVQASSYPSADDLRKRFRLHVDFQPIPDSSGFSGLDPHMLERLSKNLARKQALQATDAMQVVWVRARERITTLAERMKLETPDEKKKFKEATIENVRDLLTLLPGWNVTGSALVVEITADIERMLEGINGEIIRTSPTTRSETAASAQKIIDKMTSWGL